MNPSNESSPGCSGLSNRGLKRKRETPSQDTVEEEIKKNEPEPVPEKPEILKDEDTEQNAQEENDDAVESGRIPHGLLKRIKLYNQWLTTVKLETVQIFDELTDVPNSLWNECPAYISCRHLDSDQSDTSSGVSSNSGRE